MKLNSHCNCKRTNKHATIRWHIPFAGFLLALMGGISYAWGVFVIPMIERFGWTKGEATLPFTVFMIVFALVMVPGGIFQDKIGPRKVSAIGAVLFFLAYRLAALVGRFPYPWWLIVTYGIIGGIACGLTYACIAPPARKWFPDKPGFAVSSAVMGFGLAAVFFAPLKRGYLIPTYGIEGTFFIIAILTSAVCLFAAWLIKLPPPGWVPLGWETNKEAKATIRIRQESSPGEILKNPLFWIIWSTFVFMIAGGFVSLGLIPSYGEKTVRLTGTEAALALSIFAGFNGFGRPAAGLLGDRFGVVLVMIVTYIIQTITFLFFPIFARSFLTLCINAALLGWCYAVILALFPVLTSICFGVKHLGTNYGLVFTAFGVGAIAPAIGAWIYDVTKSFTPAFVSSGIMAGIGVCLCIVLKKKYALP